MKKDIDIVEVLMHNELIGYLQQDNKGISHFQYSNEFKLKGIEPSPIRMPIGPSVSYSFPNLNEEVFKGLPGMIADSLPDSFGDGLLNTYFKNHNLLASDNLNLLKLCLIGDKATGALEYKPSFNSITPRNNDLNLSDLVDTIKEILFNKDYLKSGDLKSIEDVISIGSSLGGAAPKAVLGIDFNTGVIRPGNIPLPPNFDYYIIKFDAFKKDGNIILQEGKGYSQVEYAYYKMAKDCNLTISDSRLISENGRSHFLTKRFDRINGEKLHVQTLNAIAHMDSYQQWDYNSYFAVLSRLKVPFEQHKEQYKRIVFNVLGGNTDTHTKNTSYLMDKKGKWTLSPFYDVICSIVPGVVGTYKHKTALNQKITNIEYADLKILAEKNNINGYKEILDEVRNTMSNWLKIAKDSGVSEEHQKHVQDIINNNDLNLKLPKQHALKKKNDKGFSI